MKSDMELIRAQIVKVTKNQPGVVQRLFDLTKSTAGAFGVAAVIDEFRRIGGGGGLLKFVDGRRTIVFVIVDAIGVINPPAKIIV